MFNPLRMQDFLACPFKNHLYASPGCQRETLCCCTCLCLVVCVFVLLYMSLSSRLSTCMHLLGAKEKTGGKLWAGALLAATGKLGEPGIFLVVHLLCNYHIHRSSIRGECEVWRFACDGQTIRKRLSCTGLPSRVQPPCAGRRPWMRSHSSRRSSVHLGGPQVPTEAM